MNNGKRIFIGLTDIAGYYQCIAKGLHEKGLNVTLYNDNKSPYNPDIFNNTSHLWFVKVLGIIQNQINGTKNSVVLPFWYILKEFINVFLFLWSLPRHDIFLFSYGRSFLNSGFDLWLIKKFQKKIIFNIGHGSDSRPPYIDGSRFSPDGTPPKEEEILSKTQKRVKALKRIEKYADAIICAPYIAQFIEKDFINWIVLGIPVYRHEQFVPNEIDKNELKVLHAPSHPYAKGTSYIRKAIAELKSEGFKFDYTELTGQPHHLVIDEIQKCDFIVDQMFSDIPMAGFTAEAGYFGKPAIIAGYALNELKSMIPNDAFPPVYACNPSEIKNAIAKLLTDAKMRQELGEQAKRFIRSQWTPEAVAGRFLKVIEGDIPETWILKPRNISYLYGATIEKKVCKSQIQKIINKYGVGALHLSHRPDLEKAFVEFANSPDND